MRKTVVKLLIFAIGILSYNCSGNSGSKIQVSKNVYLEYDQSNPQALYASKKLKEALTGNGYFVVDESLPDSYLISIAIDSLNLDDEAYSLRRQKRDDLWLPFSC